MFVREAYFRERVGMEFFFFRGQKVAGGSVPLCAVSCELLWWFLRLCKPLLLLL